MITFGTLTLKNFLSFGASPTVVKLDMPGTTLIVGKDLDNTIDGDGANGVGKTTIINALCYAIFDKPISNISKDNLVNNINKKHMEVTLEFEKNGTTYFINRVRKMKAGASGNNVHLFVNGEDKTLDSMVNTNREIERIIGIPYELFIRIVTFSANQVPFLDLPARSANGANQTDIIESLVNLKLLSEKAENLKLSMKDTDQSLKLYMAKFEQLEKEKRRHADQIKAAKTRAVTWEKQRIADIAHIDTNLKSIEGVDFDKELEAKATFDATREAKQERSAELAIVQKEIQKHQNVLDNTAKALAKLAKEMVALEKSMCPYCEQAYEKAKVKLKKCKTEEKKHNTLLNKTEKELTPLKEQDTELQQMIKDFDKTIKSLKVLDNLDDLLQVKGQIDNLTNHREKLENDDNPHLEALDELTEMDLDDDIDVAEVERLKKLQEHQQFLHKLLTKKDSFVRKALLNKNIPFLNARLNHYLDEIGLPHKVEFTHELSAKISQFGRELEFGNLSNGQRARVNISLSLAFRDVLQNLHDHINVCMFDEVLDVGLDSIGVQSAAKMLKRKARDEGLSLFIISHRDEIDSAFDRTLTVEMQKGFSYIKKGK